MKLRLVMVSIRFMDGTTLSRLAWGVVDGKKTRVDPRTYERLHLEANRRLGTTACVRRG